MGQVLVGTCSWADPSLIRCGRFYPPEVRSAESRLRYYASQFPLVEVDSSYYSLPSEDITRLWTERTPPEFTFDIKTFRLFTQHPTPPNSLPRDIAQALPEGTRLRSKLYLRDIPPELTAEMWRRLETALLPLDSTGRLGVVLFQFPPWFYPSGTNKEYLLKIRERLPRYRLAIEFRAADWLEGKYRDDTIAFLRENNLPLVCVDEPQGFRSSVPPLAEVTSDLALVRFHGRNREMWERRDATVTQRFDYLYREGELGEWVPRIKKLSAQTRQTHVLFNNCYQDKAVINARQMTFLLN